MRCKLMCLILAVAAMTMQAQACSPGLISPLEALRLPGPPARFAHVVLAEVIGARAPARLAELEAWRRQNQALVAGQLQEQAEVAAKHAADPTRVPAATDRVVELVLPTAFELQTELDLFVLENLLGPVQERLRVPAGGPCGSAPRLGQQVLVFVEPSGIAHLMQRPGEGGPVTFDDAYLDQVRACARGDCPHPEP
jgi:hypothetical protein